MNLEGYEIKVKDSMVFEFVSEGPRGKIKKRIEFIKISGTMYNLAFGDINIDTGEFDDIVVTNNNDTEKVLATVAKTVLLFIENYPQAYVYAEGSTLSRTRLYQIGISKNIEEIREIFDVFGLLEKKHWVNFEKNINYTAFLILLKKQ
jgi:hypothetical protein